ncbi:hypothetical protein EMIHUDRAFT_120338 [Emiliania huxleyi CCMP1516]|uniref:Uncharacterized protein n=2 Tax=Emiliania huxleyi TaxID=2903 RepID=A0A0D3IJN6_EMIH1|nr:hypothetical protein EMIHUDRAFT_120338 [Emiliania huxleyi CCMP1516]EOD11471.1 hypothetical protein EMIHUDRAFT_120338 [Emiliania huxleyi CCMP1516]|eukprot:XP_005763900.1 hypothetical protein EMIHUDRAFT_120338 [Emiliania huxleyi CCMP1516]
MSRRREVAVSAAALAGLAACALIFVLRRRRALAPPSAPRAPAAAQPPPPAAAAQPQPAAAAPPPPFEAGTRLVLTGLKSRPELNGQRVTVLGYDAAKGRLNVALSQGRSTIQVKPANLLPAAAPSVGEMTAKELSELGLADAAALTARHAERVARDGKTIRLWPPPRGKLERSRALNQAAPGSELVLKPVRGREIFAAATLDGLGMVTLDPTLGERADDSRFTALPAPYFAPLCHMSQALHVESLLGAVERLARAGEAHAAEEAEAARAFGAHTYFCFNASASEDSILPVTAIGRGEKGGGARGGAAWILLYTCEMLLEHARPGMEQRGIFPEGQQLAATAVPLASVLTTLQGSAANAGVHINEFVPGLAPSAKATHLESEFLSRFLALAGA